MERESNHIGEGFSRPALGFAYADAPEPITAMLARALMYSQDAERELEQAKALKMEAERYRSQVQHETVEKVEALCNGMREKASEEIEQAQQALKEAQAKDEAAAAALKQAEANREEAAAYAAKVKAEAEEYDKAVRAQADADAKALVERTRAELQEEIKLQHQRVDEEVRRALNGIEKMQAAVQEELAAQKLFTEALRLRAFAPHSEEVESGLLALERGVTERVEPARPRTRQRTSPQIRG